MDGGEWDEGEGEAVGGAVEGCEAYAVKGDEAFFDDVAAYCFGALDGDEFGVGFVFDRGDGAGAFDVSLDEMSADAGVVFEGSFEVDVDA